MATVQVMPMTDILKLKSADWPSSEVCEILDCVNISGDYHQRIKARMAETRTNLVPVLVNDGWLNNGHHRVKIAAELELTEMRVTTKGEESGWDDLWSDDSRPVL